MKIIISFLLLSTGLLFGQAYPVTASRIITGNGAPSALKCANLNAVGSVYIRKDAAAAGSSFYSCDNTAASTFAWELLGGGGAGTGTVTSVSVVTANGVSGSVATATTTPAITLTLGNITPASVASGSSPPSVTPGTGGVWACGEGTAPSAGFPASAVDGFYCDATTHKILASFNNDTALPITRTICAASKALATGAITSASSATDTLTCTGLATTDVISCSFNGAYIGVTGYVPSTSGTLGIGVYPTSNTINITVQNNTSGSITPGAITLNCRATR